MLKTTFLKKQKIQLLEISFMKWRYLYFIKS